MILMLLMMTRTSTSTNNSVLVMKTAKMDLPSLTKGAKMPSYATAWAMDG